MVPVVCSENCTAEYSFACSSQKTGTVCVCVRGLFIENWYSIGAMVYLYQYLFLHGHDAMAMAIQEPNV
jgi:hypothetical protein